MTYAGVTQHVLGNHGKRMEGLFMSLKFREFRGQDKRAASLWRAYGCLIGIFTYGTFLALPCRWRNTAPDAPFLRMASHL